MIKNNFCHNTANQRTVSTRKKKKLRCNYLALFFKQDQVLTGELKLYVFCMYSFK